ncbi:hypothetical protein, partial [Bathymodiolus thermophilus thioautotrophic gill symbiont]
CIAFCVYFVRIAYIFTTCVAHFFTTCKIKKGNYITVVQVFFLDFWGGELGEVACSMPVT